MSGIQREEISLESKREKEKEIHSEKSEEISTGGTMFTVFIWAVISLVPLAVCWAMILVNQNRPLGDELDSWDNGLATLSDPFANHPMHCKCYHHS
jgi:hypothetical protein